MRKCCVVTGQNGMQHMQPKLDLFNFSTPPVSMPTNSNKEGAYFPGQEQISAPMTHVNYMKQR